ncbi:MAG: terminase TerL endonuclease subunit [Pseudomonadota bacterium]|nr:terminase TerL endonuclease subunit [Pseudomonadota bacterium]
MEADRDYVGIAKAFAKDAVRDKGGRRHCKWVRLAARRFFDDLKRARRSDCPYHFDAWHAEDPCHFIEHLPHVEGRWNSLTIELAPWQCFVLVCLFGFRRRADGGRRFSKCYLEVARKNGKSAFAAGIVLYCATREDEPGVQIKTAATTGDQARIVWNVARKMIEATPELAAAFGLIPWANSITVGALAGDIKPINSKSSTQDGLNPHMFVVDELHAHKDRGLWDVLVTAQGARQNPLALAITTAGKDVQGVCYEQRLLLTKVLERIVEGDHYFGVIFTLDEGDDWHDESCWAKANPNLGVSKRLEYLRAKVKDATASPDSEAEVVTKDFNKWLSAASQWLSLARWDACSDPAITLETFRGRDCHIGCDLSNRDDITATVWAFEAGDQVIWIPRFYLPREVIDEKVRQMNLTFYRQWVEAGYIVPTEGDWIDSDRIEADLLASFDVIRPRSITFDTYGVGPDIAARLVADGHPAGIMAYTAKNVARAALDLEARVKSRGRLRHNGSPVLRWMASNCVVERRVDGSILPKKESKMSQGKIDGIAAGLMAMAQMDLYSEPEPPRVITYNQGDMFR